MVEYKQQNEMGDALDASPRDSFERCGSLPDYVREGCLNHLSDLGGFDAVVNDDLRYGYVRNRVVIPEEAANLFRRAHGGFLMYLIDVAACMAGYSLGKHNVTQHTAIDFVCGLELNDSVTVEAHALHNGRTTALIETVIKDSRGRTCVIAMVTLFFCRLCFIR